LELSEAVGERCRSIGLAAGDIASAALIYATPQAGHCQSGAVSFGCLVWRHLGQVTGMVSP
jgi:hypothetical protein